MAKETVSVLREVLR